MSAFRSQLTLFLRFMLSGLPSFLLAIPLNYFLVQGLGFHKLIAYPLVLLFQVSLNYVILKGYAFRGRGGSAKKFGMFGGGIVLFRILDFGLYSLFVQVLGVYYLLAQIINVGVFSVAKFIYTKYVFEGKS